MTIQLSVRNRSRVVLGNRQGAQNRIFALKPASAFDFDSDTVTASG
jgi:hypothetical protein